MPFTAHVTALVGVPPSSAWNCCVAPPLRVTVAGETVVAAPTTNEVEDTADPSGTVTPITPLVAPTGTVVLMTFASAAVTVAAAPLKVTAFCDGVALKPLPKIVTVLPTTPRVGVK